VPDEKPPDDVWHGRVPPVLSLSEVATLTVGGIVIDRPELAAAITEADTKATVRKERPLTEEHLTLMIRRQIKAEQKVEITDAILMSALRQEGSTRKAAKFLTEKTGTRVTKDQVQNASNRADTAAVLNAEDSDSVVRPVASQSRDRAGKKLIHAKPKRE
jgi:hypothetical protein